MKRRLLLSSISTSAIALGALQLTGCATQNITDYAAEKPVLDLRQYFNGTLDAYGVFTDRSGKVLGRHEGYPFYTVGQRKGLGIALGEPMFVTEIVPATNGAASQRSAVKT